MYETLPPVPRVWDVARPDAARVERLVAEAGVSARLAQLLVTRGIAEPEAAHSFLNAGAETLHPHHLLKGVAAAVEAIHGAIARGEKITIYGDYDVDGLTGSSIVFWVIKKLKGQCDIFVPHRNREGYGLSVEALRRLAAQGTKLVITIDNGTSSVSEIAEARALGMQVIVTDHHTCPPTLPDATALINPLQSDCKYPFKGLASVGLAHKLGAALLLASALPDTETLVDRFRRATIDLVAVGTIGDMAPLVGENRALVRLGLEQLARTDHHGLRSILEQDGVALEVPVSSEWVAFKLCPRLNAASRISDPAEALSLLLSRDKTEAGSLARNLTALNQRRMRLVDQLWWQALESREAWKGLSIPVAVLTTPYKGIMGLLASRMKDALGRPSIALASDGQNASGSGRSVEGFHLTRALEAVAAQCVRYGGHEQASGLTVAVDKMADFVAALQGVAAERLRPEMLIPRIRVAAELEIDELPALEEDLRRMAPFGVGNARPLFALRKVPVQDCARVGKDGRHVKLVSRKFPRGLDNIGFGLYAAARAILNTHAHIDLVVSVEKDRDRLSMKIEDVRAPGEKE
jgi:single-stranded-DNA-specific exonuclease